MDKVFEDECTSLCNNMKIKTLVSNEKDAQADAFVKDCNDGNEEGIDFDGLAHAIKPSLFTDFILETKLLQLFPSANKVDVALRDDLNIHEVISVGASQT